MSGLVSHLAVNTLVDLILFNAEQRHYGRGRDGACGVLGDLVLLAAGKTTGGQTGLMIHLGSKAQEYGGSGLMRIIAEDFLERATQSGAGIRLMDVPMNRPLQARVIAELLGAELGAAGWSEFLWLWRRAGDLREELARLKVDYGAVRQRLEAIRAEITRPELVLAQATALVYATLVGSLIEGGSIEGWRNQKTVRLGLQLLYERGVRAAYTAEAFIPMVAAAIDGRDKVSTERLMMTVYYLSRPADGVWSLDDALRAALRKADSEAIGALLSHSLLWLRANGDEEIRRAWRPTLSWLATLGGDGTLREDVIRLSITRVWPDGEIFRPEEWYDLW